MTCRSCQHSGWLHPYGLWCFLRDAKAPGLCIHFVYAPGTDEKCS